ncbi:MAG: hypothetical protein WC812_01500 [Candidatus Pacearchaeota archaeon]|jgi:hypothetical protein
MTKELLDALEQDIDSIDLHFITKFRDEKGIYLLYDDARGDEYSFKGDKDSFKPGQRVAKPDGLLYKLEEKYSQNFKFYTIGGYIQKQLDKYFKNLTEEKLRFANEIVIFELK